MINAITIADTATFGCDKVELKELSKINYIFGANGSGKTTISRVIASIKRHPSCSIDWLNNRKLQTLVYNKDFVSDNFAQSDTLNGIFTLGEGSIELLERIATAKEELSKIIIQIDKLNNTLNGGGDDDGKISQLKQLENEFGKRCWHQKRKYDGYFLEAFKGFRDSIEKFKSKILEEHENNTADFVKFDEILHKMQTVFGKKPTHITKINEIDFFKNNIPRKKFYFR